MFINLVFAIESPHWSYEFDILVKSCSAYCGKATKWQKSFFILQVGLAVQFCVQLPLFVKTRGLHFIFSPCTICSSRPFWAKNWLFLSLFFQVGLAVQFVSNCHSSSKREAYVRELRRFIPVDIYGKCGEFKCAKEKGWQCYKEAEAKYKFYLAFENSV